MGLSTSLLLLASYVLIAVLLLLALVATGLRWPVKLALVLLTAVFYFVTWEQNLALRGWPTPASMPDEFRVLWITVQEPDKERGEPGSIFYWIRPLDEADRPTDPPRAHAVPWSVRSAKSAREALRRMNEGELLNGRMTRNIVEPVEEPTTKDASGGDSDPPPAGSAAEPAFEFEAVAPPTLPAKPAPGP